MMKNSVIIDLESTAMTPIERNIITHSAVGGVILFSRNFQNPAQLKELSSEINQLRPDIFVSIDHEGGFVQRFQRHGFRALPALRVFGDTYDINPEVGIKLARHYGAIMAQDLIVCGIDLSFAPVLDLHGPSLVIGKLDRAFHSNPEVIELLAHAYIEGMNSVGMPSVCKHFPGHGSCVSDSHIAMPVAEGEVRAHDMLPFTNLIKKKKVSAIMPAFVTYPMVDNDNPAGFSSIWLKDILREELGFEGLVISDCLGMKGADVGDLLERANRAYTAGCDMVIVGNQSRSVLAELLDKLETHQSPEYMTRKQAFIEQMYRFKSDKDKLASSWPNEFLQQELSANSRGIEPDTTLDSINNTKSV